MDGENTPNTQAPPIEGDTVAANKFVRVIRPKTNNSGNPDMMWVVFNDNLVASKPNGPTARTHWTRVWKVLIRPKTDEDRRRDAERQAQRQQGGQQGGGYQ